MRSLVPSRFPLLRSVSVVALLVIALAGCVPGAITVAPPANPPKAVPPPPKRTSPPPPKRTTPPKTTGSRPILPSVYAYQVHDSEQPNAKSYIKTNGQFVLVTSKGEQVLGKKAPSEDRNYQWKIVLASGEGIYVDRSYEAWGWGKNGKWASMATITPLRSSTRPPSAKRTSPPPSKTTRAKPLPSAYVYQVKDADEPNTKAYIKTNGELVIVTPQGERIAGKKARSEHRDYQWKIVLVNGKTGYIDRENNVWSYNDDGNWAWTGSVIPLR